MTSQDAIRLLAEYTTPARPKLPPPSRLDDSGQLMIWATSVLSPKYIKGEAPTPGVMPLDIDVVQGYVAAGSRELDRLISVSRKTARQIVEEYNRRRTKRIAPALTNVILDDCRHGRYDMDPRCFSGLADALDVPASHLWEAYGYQAAQKRTTGDVEYERYERPLTRPRHGEADLVSADRQLEKILKESPGALRPGDIWLDDTSPNT